MIYSAIYKLKIKKETEKLYNLGGQPLINLQEKYIKSITAMLQRWYKVALNDLKNNKEAQYNELFIDQKQFISKEFTQDDFSMYSKMMKDGFNVGAKQLNQAFKNDIRIDTSFSIDPADSLKYANEFAGARIKGIDEYSQKRIKAFVSQGLEKGWGYNKLAKELKLDYSFSPYRARLIASQEIGEAYLNGKDRQFERYTKNFGQKGWKHWISHRDQRTTAGCLGNDNQGWIPYDQDFESGHAKPTRFPGCRCNVVYRLFDPRDNGETVTPQNADKVDTEQSTILEMDEFDDGIKPENYDKYSSKVLPAKFFNSIGEQSTYIEPKGRAYYNRGGNKINIGEKVSEYEKQKTELHEVGHFFYTKVVMKDEVKFSHFKSVFKDSIAEVKELIKDKEMRGILNPNNTWSTVAKRLFEKVENLANNTAYTVDVEIGTSPAGNKFERIKLSDQLKDDIGSFMDTIGALTKEQLVGNGHGKSYYKNSMVLFRDGLSKITEMQTQEYFAHLNETYWMGNSVIEELLPKTHQAMKDFYKSIGYSDFI